MFIILNNLSVFTQKDLNFGFELIFSLRLGNFIGFIYFFIFIILVINLEFCCAEIYFGFILLKIEILFDRYQLVCLTDRVNSDYGGCYFYGMMALALGLGLKMRMSMRRMSLCLCFGWGFFISFLI